MQYKYKENKTGSDSLMHSMPTSESREQEKSSDITELNVSYWKSEAAKKKWITTHLYTISNIKIKKKQIQCSSEIKTKAKIQSEAKLSQFTS